MKTLFAISIVAVLALLWASISIAQHVRRARRRRRELEVSNRVLISIANEEKAEQHVAAPPPPIPFANASERADWAHFNKDFGDLSDPYESPRNGTKG